MSLYKPTSGGKTRRLSPYWCAHIRSYDGRVISLSTKLRDKRTAKRLEAVWVRAAEDGRNGHMDAQTARRYVDECARVSRGEPLRQSERYIADCLQESTGGGSQVTSVEQYFASWLSEKAGSGRNSSSTLARYRPVLERFLESLPAARRSGALSKISTPDCTDFLQSEVARGVSSVSANQSIRILRIVFNTALRHGIIDRNPAVAVDMRHEEPHRREPFSVEQVRRLVEVADVEWRGLILTGFYAGIRLGDGSKLTWRNVDLERGLLTFQAQKTSRRKRGADKDTVVDLHPDLAAYFANLQPGVPLAPIFPSLHGRSVGSESGLSAAFRRLMDKAGVISPVRAGKRQFRALSFHSLRHTFCTQLHSAGVPMELRKALAGHSSDAMAANYTETSRSLTAAAIAQLPSVEKAA